MGRYDSGDFVLCHLLHGALGSLQDFFSHLCQLNNEEQGHLGNLTSDGIGSFTEYVCINVIYSTFDFG